MAGFDQLQKIWKAQKSVQNLPQVDTLREAKTTRDKLMKQAATSCIIFLFVTIYTVVLKYYLTLSEEAHFAVLALALICLAQSGVHGYSWYLLRRISELQPPALFANAWKKYYHQRKKILAISSPIYFTVINIALIVIFIDALAQLSVWQRILFMILYVVWIVVSWFFVRKKVLEKEFYRITSTIDNLTNIAIHLENESSISEKDSTEEK